MSEKLTFLDRLVNPGAVAEGRGEKRGSLETRRKIIDEQLPMINDLINRLGEVCRVKDSNAVDSEERERMEKEEYFLTRVLRGFERSLKIDIGDQLEGRYPGDRFEYGRTSCYYRRDIQSIEVGDLVEVVTVKIEDSAFWSQAAESGRFVVYQEGKIKLIMTEEELNKR